MLIRKAAAADIDDWAALRAELWPEASADEHRQELAETSFDDDDRAVCFLAVDAAGAILAFAEASLRTDYVNGCETSPVAFLEGIYVRPRHRRTGLGQALSAAVEQWARATGCTELASDALLENTASHRFHGAIGFEETERVVYFRKQLGS
ncbi:GNAT family N-acetyltransferase [Sphingomonas cannabina]|uniref:aminoglycoside 6'-N-acetyltransferase n=1 Tax=Sphingomonas cannabina TaxID=2899123 RepID=UPI001F46D68E|nr:aminoglycoside 6'-N-acetyltransferase [Sphingomonas cannabina]UIJ46256.1 GNAT family N-acetyltransferase [Sphingomonas cannabina]